MYNQVAVGDYSYVQALRSLPGANPAAACQREQVSARWLGTARAGMLGMLGVQCGGCFGPFWL